MASIDFNWRNFVKKGDDPSFSNIYNRHVDDLFSYGVGLGFQQEACKDAIQDIFYKLYISKDNLSHIENITAYIFRSFKHRLIDISRKSKREETSEAAVALATESFTVQVTVLDHMIDSEKTEIIKQKVTALMNGLTANQREVVYLRYMIGLSYKEIGEVLGINEESARKSLYRTMEKLRQQTSYEDFHEGLSMLLLLLLLRQ